MVDLPDSAGLGGSPTFSSPPNPCRVLGGTKAWDPRPPGPWTAWEDEFGSSAPRSPGMKPRPYGRGYTWDVPATNIPSPLDTFAPNMTICSSCAAPPEKKPTPHGRFSGGRGLALLTMGDVEANAGAPAPTDFGGSDTTARVGAARQQGPLPVTIGQGSHDPYGTVLDPDRPLTLPIRTSYRIRQIHIGKSIPE